MTTLWPQPISSREDLVHRWEALLLKAPRLRPWLGQMLGQKRLFLSESGEADIDSILWDDLARWLRDFEALPPLAVAAIATTLQEERAVPPQTPAREPPGEGASPERQVAELQTLLCDPAFALAFHCVEARVRPQLAPMIPEAAWFGLLHASVRQEPALTAQTAVSLVVRMLGRDWARVPAPARQAALRLFHAGPADLRGDLRRICAALPAGWNLSPESLPDFVAAAARARLGLAEASALCARFVAAVKSRPGGLALLTVEGIAPASPAELAELARNARRHAGMTGFPRLMELL
jgi:hypothetical protein